MKKFPFTKSHIEQFKYEMKKAGGFFELMYEKEAVVLRHRLKFIAIKYNPETYKRKFITGKYDDLQSYFDHDIPLLFWIEFLKYTV